MSDTRSPAHRLGQALLDRGLRPRPTLWTDELEAAYSAAINEAGLVPAPSRDRIWVNEGRTVMVRLWANGTMEICTRVSPDAIWPPPIYVLEEK